MLRGALGGVIFNGTGQNGGLVFKPCKLHSHACIRITLQNPPPPPSLSSLLGGGWLTWQKLGCGSLKINRQCSVGMFASLAQWGWKLMVKAEEGIFAHAQKQCCLLLQVFFLD